MVQVYNDAGGSSFRTNVEFGHNGVFSGQTTYSGSTSGATIVQVPAAAGSYNFNLPITAGTAGQPLLSGGGGAANQTYGTLGLAAGGTNANLSATGGTSQVLKQTSVGGTITVAQLAAADLSNYTEGTWTPVLTFATPGDLAVAYTTQLGTYTRVGRLVTVTFNVVTSSFTFTTASGACNITGLPFTSLNVSGQHYVGTMMVGGITKAGFTQFVPRVTNNVTLVEIMANASGAGSANVVATDMPSGGTVNFRATLTYQV